MYGLLTCKVVYVYEYYNSSSRLCEEKLPSVKTFYNSTHDLQCITADYEFAKKAWTKQRFKNEEEYCKMFLRSCDAVGCCL